MLKFQSYLKMVMCGGDNWMKNVQTRNRTGHTSSGV